MRFCPKPKPEPDHFMSLEPITTDEIDAPSWVRDARKYTRREPFSSLQ